MKSLLLAVALMFVPRFDDPVVFHISDALQSQSVASWPMLRAANARLTGMSVW